MPSTAANGTLLKLLLGTTAAVVLTWTMLHRSERSTALRRTDGDPAAGAATVTAKDYFRCESSITIKPRMWHDTLQAATQTLARLITEHDRHDAAVA